MSAEAVRQREETYFFLCGQALRLLPQGGLWWPDERTLIVSDLHLEKGSRYAAGGQFLPPYDTSGTLRIVEALAEILNPWRIISLGDSFHDADAEYRLCPEDRARIRQLTKAHEWWWIEGNHDPDPPAHLGGHAARSLRIGDLVFRHEPESEPGEIAGHLHPVAKLVNRSRSLRRRCFISDGQRMVMPAMGTLTGGLNVLHPAFDGMAQSGATVFALGRERVSLVSCGALQGEGALVQDGPRRAWRL